MKLIKPKFWKSNFNIYSILLFPFTFFILITIFLKKLISIPDNFKIPIICIGNIYIGGTGKTPLSIFIADELKKAKKNPVVIKKYYKNQKDEQLLIKNSGNSLILNKKRSNAIKVAEKRFDTVILDDGFQDYTIKKDLNILCFHGDQLIGNGYVIPSGPLRESISSLKKTELIIINGKKNKKFEKKVLKINKYIKIFYSKYTPINIKKYKNKKILAIAGIGNPENFFNLLKNHGCNIVRKFTFPDHYNFKKKELLKIIQIANKNKYTILTTEKDYLRIKKFKLKKIKYCSINIKIQKKRELIEQIKKIYV
jgi:tetraacyldisaccharide 4'-kinase